MRLNHLTLGVFLFMQLLCVDNSANINAEEMDYQQELQNFQTYNPDGQKYEFVKAYLTSLLYLDKNRKRLDDQKKINFKLLQNPHFVTDLLNDLSKNNVNLRVSRNLLKKYKTSSNGLILKTANMFVSICDDHIGVNKKEYDLFMDILGHLEKGNLKDFDRNNLIHQKEELAEKRRSINKALLESSMLVGVVLISDYTDEDGDLIALGITEKERKNLLSKIGQFSVKDQNLVGGQTFLEGSIVSIKEVLMDGEWATLEEGLE